MPLRAVEEEAGCKAGVPGLGLSRTWAGRIRATLVRPVPGYGCRLSPPDVRSLTVDLPGSSPHL